MLKSFSSFLTRQKERIPRIPLEWLYVLIAFTFGIIFIILIPPGWNPDEPQHYWRIQQLTDGNIVSDPFESNGRVETGGQLPLTSANFVLSYGGYRTLDNPDFRLSFPMWNNPDVSKDIKEGGQGVNLNFSGSARYSPIVYAPQTIAMWITEKLNMSLLTGFFAAKIAGLVVQLLAIFWAIRLIPRGKWILFTIGLLPSTVVQSTALGGDVMTTSVCIIFIALTIKLAYKLEPPKIIEISSILLLIALLGLVKPAYLPLSAILLILPIMNRYYRDKKRIAILGSVAALMTLPGILWLKMTNFIVDYFSRPVQPDLQLSYILNQPLEYVSVLFRTYFTEDQPRLFKTLFGNFIWDTAPLPLICMFFGAVVLCLSLFVSSKRERTYLKKSFPNAAKLLLVSVFVGLIVVISTGLYLMYTDYKATSVLGLQGRYYIPFLILPLILLATPLTYKKQKGVKIAIVIILLLMLLSAINVIWERIYT